MISCSVIVPAYHEKLNVEPLTRRLFEALGNKKSKETELIFVDDNSQDGSVEEVERLQKAGYNVRIIVRTTERGLSSAVLRGFKEAKGQYLICMDADLQHPPEVVPTMIQQLEKNPFVLGTRYAPGIEIDKDWPLYRRVISSGARLLALPLTPASDPMSGFFGLQSKYLFNGEGDQRHIIEGINDKGFKIALELLTKIPLPNGGKGSIVDVPFTFGVRVEGESKLSSKVMIQYLQQLKDLYIYKFGIAQLLIFLVLLVLVALYFLSFFL
ncbi:hypothetical protein PACTADRAFT_52006 [Pachysolen tannophilus NRRL Y-2460]|uniref:Dolichol-phosphate mannosyltransferase subunit 1 n=1 Tax=Pachysolen tannophilus NRRL Y-2460 TaxID=669874 RepID=A0A1E4TNS9_PACTA|nr:hypothetical protein PACTADRAFT_52006 [Pachysolen tannophilus NRRL Y-2460]